MPGLGPGPKVIALLSWRLICSYFALFYALLGQSSRLVCRAKLANMLLLNVGEHLIQILLLHSASACTADCAWRTTPFATTNPTATTTPRGWLTIFSDLVLDWLFYRFYWSTLYHILIL